MVPIDRGDVGVRIDRVLLRHLGGEPGVSRARIQKWIGAGDVLVNGAPVPRVAWRVADGDDVRVRIAEPRPRERPVGEAIPLDILYEDDDLLAVNKAAGLVVHPSYKNTSGTLMNGLLWHARDWRSGDKPALLTRLDKNTSGVILVAKRHDVLVALQHEMSAQRIDKDYLAVVHGKPSPARGTIDLALDTDPWDRRRVTVTDRGGQRAVTRYERLGVAEHPEMGVTSVLRCRLVTGRMHQIRVHLQSKGWPVVGDPTYGWKGSRIAFARQALHAWRVTLRHPTRRTSLTVVAPVPADIQALMQQLGLPLDDL